MNWLFQDLRHGRANQSGDCVIPTMRFQRNILSVLVILLAVCLLVTTSFAVRPAGEARKAASAPAPLAPGAYFGLKLPGETPELFAPGIINTPGRSVGHLAFSPDGTECYFTVFDGAWNNPRILFTRYENGAWTPQVPVTFADGRLKFEPLFSRNGNILYFGVANSTDVDFWMVQRVSREQEWSNPQPLPAPLNSPKNEYRLAQAADGTMYFASNRDGGLGGMDIYRTVSKPGEPLQVENLGPPVNTEFTDTDPAISPDGHILVFVSKPKRPGVMYDADLFIYFDNGHGGWTTPVNMGEGFNTLGDEFAATFSQDGRVLFFARFDGKQGSVYSVSTTALERFRKLSH